MRRLRPFMMSWQASNVGSVDEPLVASLEDLSVSVQLADVEAVAEDVGERRAVEAGWLGRKTCPSRSRCVGQALEGVAAAGVQIKDADQRCDFSGCGWIGSSRSSTLM